MSKNLIYTLGMLALSTLAEPSVSLAQDYGQTVNEPQSAYLLQQEGGQQLDPVMEDISHLQHEWARIKYQIADEHTQSTELKKLGGEAAAVTSKYPNRAEPKIWQGIILSTKAGIDGGLGALSAVKEAKALFESAIKQNEKALNGSAHTSLGSVYYKVPGWPVGFGDDDEAEKHLKKALQINPNGLDPNFFYADFLMEEGRYDEAKTYLNRALQAADRPDRPLADAGRRQEIKAALAKINEKSDDEKITQYN